MLWRVLVTLSVAALLAAADLAHKAVSVTPSWGYHVRSGAWVVLATGVVVGCLLLARVPSRPVAVAAGMLAGGAGGNVLSAVSSGEGVPNPIVLEGSTHAVAFNLADLFTLAGILLLTSLLVMVTLDHRDRLLPPRAALRAARRRIGGQ